MSAERIDPATLAGLIDGTLTPAARAEVLSAIARSEESYEDLIEATAILNELEQAPATPADRVASSEITQRPQLAKRSRVWQRAQVWLPALAAAGFVGLLLLPKRPTDAGRIVSTVRSASPLASKGAKINAIYAASWNQPGWSEARGAENQIDSDATAFRLGVRFAEFELAVASTDSEAILSATATLVRIVAPMPGGNLVATAVEATKRTVESAEDHTRLAESLRRLSPGAEWFDLGAWCESARLAVAANRLEFFDSSNVPTAELRRLLETIDRMPPETRRAGRVAAPLREILGSSGARPYDVPAIAKLLDSALAFGAR